MGTDWWSSSTGSPGGGLFLSIPSSHRGAAGGRGRGERAARADDGLRPVVEENLAEELSSGRTPPELWRDFAAAVGTSQRELDNSAPLPGTRALVETFRRLCREGSPVEAVAALYVYEAQVPEIAAKKITGLRSFYGVSEPKGLAYFAVHEEADVGHRAPWRCWLAR